MSRKLDGLDPQAVWSGRLARLITRDGSDGQELFEVVDWAVGKDQVCRSLRLRSVDGSGTQWVTADRVRLMGDGRRKA